ncbi:MAG: Clp protease N-terminal domain-containing protein [bacterium]
MFFTNTRPASAQQFTQDCRDTLAAARGEAGSAGSAAVDTEHLLVALLRRPKSDAAAVLVWLGVDIARLARKIQASPEYRTDRHIQGPHSDNAPEYSSAAKRALELAMREASTHGMNPMGSEHLVLGLLLQTRSRAARELTAVGITINLVRDAIGYSTGKAAAPAFRVNIDDASSQSIHDQIVQQIRAAVAFGRLQPGDRIATVRSLADELRIAPGTVARAYTELERVGVVETSRVFGTRIAAPATPLTSNERAEKLAELLRPVAVAAFHLGASAAEVETALRRISVHILPSESTRK